MDGIHGIGTIITIIGTTGAGMTGIMMVDTAMTQTTTTTVIKIPTNNQTGIKEMRVITHFFVRRD